MSRRGTAEKRTAKSDPIFRNRLVNMVVKDLLDNRKQRILSTIRNSEELRRGTIEQLEKARIRLQKVELLPS